MTNHKESEMTLKEISEELGKPIHALANTLRQVGLADRTLSGDDRLTPEQEQRLRNGNPKKKRESSYGCATNEAEEDSKTSDYTVENLAKELGIAEGRVLNILHIYGWDASAKTTITHGLKERIASDYKIATDGKHASLFYGHNIKDIKDIWERPITNASTPHYSPGSKTSGRVISVDYDTRVIKVHFDEEISDNVIPSIFKWFYQDAPPKKTIRVPAMDGTVSFEEWDWELRDEFRTLPKAGDQETFLILSNEFDSGLTLSRRRLSSPPPRPGDGLAEVVEIRENDRYLILRQDNGAYGFMSCRNAGYFNFGIRYSVGDILEAKVRNTYRRKVNDNYYFFSEFVLADEEKQGQRNGMAELLVGLNHLETIDSAKYDTLNYGYLNQGSLNVGSIYDWSDVLQAWEDNDTVKGRVEEINSGGYILSTEQDIKLFCPNSRTPGRAKIEDSLREKMIGAEWLVKIKTEPSDWAEKNAVVDAKLEPSDYESLYKVGGFYKALVYNCNEYGANVLIENSVPMFIPNGYFGWRNDNDAQRELKLGEEVVVKIIKDKKGTGAIASIRDAVMDPWLQIQTLLPVGAVAEGKIVRKEQRWIHLDINGHPACLSAKKISWTEDIEDCTEVDLPDEIRVLIEGHNEKHRSIDVNYRVLLPNPWDKIEEYLPGDRVMLAMVKSKTQRGANLKVGDLGLAGYLSYRDVDWCKDVDKDSFPYSEGEILKVKVTRWNNERRRLTCSLKELEENPWESMPETGHIEGTVISVKERHADVVLGNMIQCVCRESLPEDALGQTLTFEIQHLDKKTQKIAISLRKQEISALNTLAIGEMFKPYRNLSEEDKELLPVPSATDPPSAAIRDFRVVEVSSTGRVKLEYAGDDEEYEHGILLPNSVTVGGHPINIVFAREILKRHLTPGNVYSFEVTNKYRSFPYAVVTFDAEDVLHLKDISTADLDTLRPGMKVTVQVLRDISFELYVFVHWNGYFGYIPRRELLTVQDEMPESLCLTVASYEHHPQQMIRFAMPDADMEREEKDESVTSDEMAKRLDEDLYDCYTEVRNLEGFIPETPDLYPFDLQFRYDPEKLPELANMDESELSDLIGGTMHLVCTPDKSEKGWNLNIFNPSVSFNAHCSAGEEYDEIWINSTSLGNDSKTNAGRAFHRPLRIRRENIQILQKNAGAIPPKTQEGEILMALQRYNQVVLPELDKLKHGYLKERGEHYLTLEELIRLDLEREEALGRKVIALHPSDLNETDGGLGNCAVTFSIPDETFDGITSPDDDMSGISVYVKLNDGEGFPTNPRKLNSVPKGKLRQRSTGKWAIHLYKDSDMDLDEAARLGLLLKRIPNTRHLKKEILAINDYVYENNGLDIFGKIARGKIGTPKFPDPKDIIANKNINLEDPADSQANAIKMALGGSSLTLIQGPPGTGKSTVIADIICNLVRQGKKVLVCTQSVAPVRELYYKISGRRDGKSTGEPKRVDGHEIRCAYLRDDDSMELSGSVEELKQALKQVPLLLDALDKAETSQDETTAATIDNRIASVDTCRDGKGSRIGKYFHDEFKPRLPEIREALSNYINALDRDDVANFHSNRVLQKDAVDVVFGTCIGVGVSKYLKDVRFDTLIIDEAGKANYAETFVPMKMADEYILVGDDRQLPPYTNSDLVRQLARKRLEEELPEDETITEEVFEEQYVRPIMENVSQSLFGDLRKKLPATNVTMLSRQFRMHPKIGDFVSKLFYDGKVESMVNPEDRTLNFEGLEAPVMFYDTSMMGPEARETRAGKSLRNEGEVRIIEEQLMTSLKEAKAKGKSVGILSPYGAQVQLMKERFKKHGLDRDIFTIDSIQGEEYDIVVFSFVRNTNKGNLNFIDSLNRLNVSFSRARCNLIMVGHMDTLMNESLHKEDREAVLAVYREIQSEKVKQIALPGAMRTLHSDFPPESCPLTEDLSSPYVTFEDCRPKGKGRFSVIYKGRLLELYNPVLEKYPHRFPGSFRAHLLGYVGNTPYTMLEPMSSWLGGYEGAKYRFKARVESIGEGRIAVRLEDGSMAEFRLPESDDLQVDSTKGSNAKTTNDKFSGNKTKVLTINRREK